MTFRPSFLLLLAVQVAAAQEPIRGFTPAGAKHELELESKAIASIDAVRIGQHIKIMSAKPHAAGSAASKEVANYALEQFRKSGLEVRIETFEALLPYPVERTLEMVSPVRHKFRLIEPILKEDPDSSDAHQLPSYNAYSASGEVTAPVVYVNYGVPEDYDYLKKLGIDVRGKIVLARYGKSWRGTKPKVAAENGAVACLIYSDPKDDGYWKGDVYPLGPFRPAQGIQRGSVMDMPLYVGDPLTPGWASEPGGKKLAIKDAKTLMTIPVMPISYGDAKPILEKLEGPVAPDDWRGALPFTYHIGAGPATVHLRLKLDNGIRPIHNVVATIQGQTPDQWVIYGNHHDAWVNGAHDPISGAAVVLETAHVLGALKKTGWKPKRTIVFTLWDAEEFGLVGSTEWVEKHRDELRAKAVLYINSDTNGRGSLGAGGSYSLEQFMEQIARDVKDPETGKSLLHSQKRAVTRTPAPDPNAHLSLKLEPLGAGSDYVAFFHFAGVPSLNIGFADPSGGGVYHSIYDSYAWYTRFGDKNFEYGKALAEVMSRTILRMAESHVLPFEFSRLAATVKQHVEEIEKLAGPSNSKIDWQTAKAELTRMAELSKSFETQMARLTAVAANGNGALTSANAMLARAEQSLQAASGLPDRTWYKNVLTAPGMYTGYGAKTLPGVREAVDRSRWSEASEQAKVLGAVLKKFNNTLEEVTAQFDRIR